VPKLVNEAVKKEVEEEERLCKKEKKFANSNVHLFRGPQRWGLRMPSLPRTMSFTRNMRSTFMEINFERKVLSASAALNVAVQHFRINSMERICKTYSF
jgi:hypothetical protein